MSRFYELMVVQGKTLAEANEIANREAQGKLAAPTGSADWKYIAAELAVALERLDALYRSEQDPEAPIIRPEWLSRPLQRYHCALPDSSNAERSDRE